MSSLTTMLRNTPTNESEDDKLLDLFQNRNALKQEFAELRNEKYRLQDRIKQQDGAIARLQQKLDQLERLLVDPDWAHNILTFYQLRGLGLRCQSKIARFAEQLKQQRESKRQREVTERWRQDQRGEVEVLMGRLAEKRQAVADLEDRLQASNRQLESMGSIGRLFKRRALNQESDELVESIAQLESEEDELRQQIAAIESREPPGVVGLDLAAKRSINYMILAFAQQLYILHQDDELITFVREASEKSPGAVKYGDKQDCDSILGRVARSSENLFSGNDFAESLKVAAKLISERAVYQNDDDAVPAAGTVTTLFRVGKNGLVTEGDANILGSNLWGVAGVLSR